jgi:hypothetical protein
LGALPRYMSDVASTTAMLSGQGLACSGDCGVNPLCCVSGRCQWSPECPAPRNDAGAACPAGLPMTGSPCTPYGGVCGYTTTTNACGATNCYCESGTWGCEPSCIIPRDAAADTSVSDAADASAE